MKIKKIKNNQYKVESSSKKGKFYNVDVKKSFCSCPQFMFRLIKTGGKCKHILAVEEHLSKKEKASRRLKTKKEPDKNKIIEYVKKKKEVNSIELIKKFGEGVVDGLIKHAELIEFNGKIKVLE